MKRAMLSVAFVGSLCLQSEGAIVVSMSDLDLLPDESGFVDVFIYSDQPAGEAITRYSFEFLITDTAGSNLEFAVPPPAPQLLDTNYVFAGVNSLKKASGSVGIVSNNPLGGPNERYVGSDLTLPFFPPTSVTIPNTPGTPLLLARLNVTHDSFGTGSATLGDSFDVNLNNSDRRPLHGDVLCQRVF